MRFEHEGMSLWYGTPDAPSPRETVQVGTGITITVGVQPMNAGNNVEVLYRINQGSMEKVAAKWLRNDTYKKSQYFRASLPAFRAGDMVEYTALCRRAGRWVVPAPEEVEHFASSFRVTDSMVGPEPSLAHNDGAMSTQAMATISPREPVSSGSLASPLLQPGPVQVQQTRKSPRSSEAHIQTYPGLPVPSLKPSTVSLSELATTLRLGLPRQLLPTLEKHGIRTLADIREVGGIRHIEGLSVAANDPALHTLEAHAKLNVLSSDVALNSILIDKGFTSVGAIAHTSQSVFINTLREQLGDFKAMQIHLQARAQRDFLSNVLTQIRADRANGFANPLADQVADLEGIDSCECSDCRAAVSPAAYLLDLLDFAIQKLTSSNGPIDLSWLTANLHQPFADLVVSCGAVESLVHQVRICSEVLRSYVAAGAPLPGESEYRLAAYQSLLSKVGTSYEEIRLARSDPAEKRQALAERLGIELDTPQPDHLDTLLLDPKTLSEEQLEELFGLADTTRPPLSDGAKRNDPGNHITRWNLAGVTWGQNTDAEGVIYASLTSTIQVIGTDPTSPPEEVIILRVSLFRDSLGTQLVAFGQQPTFTGVGSVLLSEQNNSGLSGQIDVNFGGNQANTSLAARLPARAAAAGDGSLIELQAVPRFLSWRLKHLRTLWEAQDRPPLPKTAPPIIDPDLIGQLDFKNPNPMDPAYQLWQNRGNQLSQQLNAWSSQIGNQPGNIDPLIASVLGTSITELLALRDQRRQGKDITARLNQLNIALDAFLRLLRLRDLALSNVQLLEEEWAEFYSILLQTWKRQQFASWQSEEEVQHILLSPDFFVIPAPTLLPSAPQPTFVLIKWHATQQARNDWQDTLQARIDQQQAIQGGLATAVDICEEETLPMLRDALLMAVDPAEQDLQSKAKWFTTNLLIDAQVAGCQKTTRIAQAIETVQGAIFAARSGQSSIFGFNNADPIFDEEWQWIGSYAAWRAAMFIFLYPENVLIPTLRKPEQQTPAFRNLIDTLRPNRRLTPEQACEAASAYSQYFRDVCNLTIEVSCTALTHVQGGDCRHKAQTQGDRMLFYVFGRGVSNTVYWSTYDAQAQPGGSQTFWDTVPGLDSAVQIIGAVPYFPSDRQHQILLFARTQEQSMQKLVFTTYDLLGQRWSGKLIELSLPQNESTFTATVQQRDNLNHPPLVVICIKGGQGTKDGDQDLSGQTLLYSRRLNRAATDWDAFNFLRINFTPLLASIPPTGPLIKVLALLTEVYPVVVVGNPPGESELSALFVETRDGFLIGQWLSGYFDPQGELYFGNSDVVTLNMYYRLIAQKSFLGAFTYPNPSIQYDTHNLYVFIRDPQSGSVTYGLTGIADNANVPISFDWAESGMLQRVAAHSGYDPSSGRQVVRQDLTPLSQSTIASFTQNQNDNSLWYWEILIAPLDSGPYEISEQFTESDLLERALEIQSAYASTLVSGKYFLSLESNRVYLDEAYYFVPVSLALQLQDVGQYIAALDWFRTVYDYAAPDGQRFIWDGFRQEQGSFPVLQRGPDWLLDPLNPHQIAANRAGTYLRFTLLALVRCFLDYADAEFTRDTAESIPRARRLYMTAQELLNLKELNLQFGQCSTIIGELDIPLGGEWTGAARRLKQALAGISDKATLKAIVAQLQEVFQGNGSMEARFERAQQLVRQAQERASSALTISGVFEQRSRATEQAERALVARPEISAALQEIGAVVGRDFQLRVAAFCGISSERLLQERVALPWLASPTEITTARANENPGSPWQLLVDRLHAPAHLTSAAPVDTMPHTDGAKSIARIAMGRVQPFGGQGGGGGSFVFGPAIGFCIPQNPLLVALHLRAELNLFKLRNCRNIAGDVRSLEPYTAPTDTSSGLPEIGTGQTLILPGVATLAPTPYRYTVLIERAKQLANSAQQIEAALLLALEKRDSEYYTLLKARQDVSLTQATVRLQDLMVTEAQSSVKVAELQQERAQTQADHFKKLLDEGISDLELASMDLLKTAADVQIAASVINFLAATLPSSTGANFSYSPQGMATAIAGGLSSIAGSLSTQASILSTLASYERRAQDWEFQQSLAQQDIKIGAQQVKVAQDHVRVAGQQHKIAELQAEHAQAVVEFLGNKFTSYELYDWMSGVLEGVYSYFLQQATATAQLALNQLAFERQQTPPPFIRADYWQPPAENGQPPDGKAPDRRGLTGSARLLQDITQLDQYRFDTDKRKLQLVKTISIARLAPEAFVRFQETGVLTFETPMEQFDRDFPGHYLRLIKRVRVSVVALIPPTNGIRATLTSDRISRVVIGGDIFQTVKVQHGPDYVALSSPREATGLFELDVQSDMLLPFEGIGVATNWELRMPKAANLFDYRTIADVLFTIEYMALNSFTYGQQVIQTLRPDLSAQRPFSFSNQFADAWYDLHNSDQVAPPAVPMTVQFTTIREDFPPNLDDLKIQHVALYFVRKADNPFEVVSVQLHFTPKGDTVAVGGSADSIDGIISTRNGNGSSWISMIGLSPVGEWELALPDTKDDGGQTRDYFKNEDIEDMLFVITYSGRTPAWPT